VTHITIQLPFKGFTEQSSFSAVPQGMTPSCLNVMPIDIWNGRTRISTRNGTKLFNLGSIQFMSTYRVYESGVLVEKLIFVRNGKVYYANPRDDLTATATLFGGQSSTTFLNSDTLVEGVQFNEHFYFVDGTHYVFVTLTTPAASTAVAVWGAANHGPFRTDPNSAVAGERATLICRWGPRLVLAGYKRTPNIWYACAPDQPFAWSGAHGGGAPTDGWTGTDILGAVSGSTYADYGTLGDPIVSIFPFSQSGLMFACTNSFSFLTTDPVFEESASMVNLTRSIGIAGRRAWCQSQEKGAWILANDGLYYLAPNDFNFNRGSRVSAGRLDSFFLRLDFGTPAIGGSGPLSGGTLESLLTENGSPTGASSKVITSGGGLSQTNQQEDVLVQSQVAAIIGNTLASGQVFPCLCYDPDREGVWIFLSVSGAESSSIHLFYDLKTDSFWPQRFSDPNIYAPISACYVGTSRTDSGRLFMGGTESVSIIDKTFPIGVDGWDPEMDADQQRRQFVRSSLSFGPIMGQLPYRVMLNEVRVDLADDKYEYPSDVVDASADNNVTLSITTGDTAQSALGLQADSLFVININPLVIDGGSASTSVFDNTYDGGTIAVPSPHFIDGRFAVRPWGQYTQDDPFASGTDRVYDGPWNWVLRWDSSDKWTIALQNGAGWNIEYQQVDPDAASPDGLMVTATQNPITPNAKDNASVSGASFPESEVIQIGTLVSGRNTAQKCRIRAEAMYMTIASDGKPWSIERASAVVSQVGKSRGGV
jgi:hypothetical protein